MTRPRRNPGAPSSEVLGYTTKELSRETWRDFETLFAKHGGVQAGCWCMYYHRPRPLPARDLPRGNRSARNLQDKRDLVRSDRSHGVLVYAGDDAVGWCQYGLRDELPRIDAGRNYRRLDLPRDGGKQWRITCFFVDNAYRGKGVAQTALRAALRSIRAKGGGVVEAYPATHRRAVAIWFGTVEMFEREQFAKVAALGRSNVVMRRTL